MLLIASCIHDTFSLSRTGVGSKEMLASLRSAFAYLLGEHPALMTSAISEAVWIGIIFEASP